MRGRGSSEGSSLPTHATRRVSFLGSAYICGALLDGALLMRVGHRNALMLFRLLQALGLFGYLVVVEDLPSLPTLYLIVCCEQFADGLSTVALVTAMMDVCHRHSPAPSTRCRLRCR